MPSHPFLKQVFSLKEQIGFTSKFKSDHSSSTCIVISGMGGSGVAGRIFAEMYSAKPVIVVDSYELPEFVNKSYFFVAVSYSGNTEETLNTVREAKKRGIQIHSITTGGELESLSDECINVPKGLQPREAIGYLLMPLVNSFLDINNEEIEKTLKLLDALESNSSPTWNLAQKITDSGKIPYILSWEPFKAMSYRFKTQFNENSKMFAVSHTLSEQNHNELVPLLMNEEMSSKFFFIVIEGAESRNTNRLELVEKGSGLSFVHIVPKGDSQFQKLFYLLHFIDFVTVQAAVNRSIDPEDVKVLENLKNELKKIK